MGLVDRSRSEGWAAVEAAAVSNNEIMLRGDAPVDQDQRNSLLGEKAGEDRGEGESGVSSLP